jgi:hypothetical protein
MRPKGLLATVAAMLILNLTGYVGLDWTRRNLVLTTVLISVVSYVVLWFYWVGRNWARRLVLFVSIVALFDLVFLFRSPVHSPAKIFKYDTIVIANALLGVFLLYWLNRADVREWFKARPDSVAQETIPPD